MWIIGLIVFITLCVWGASLFLSILGDLYKLWLIQSQPEETAIDKFSGQKKQKVSSADKFTDECFQEAVNTLNSDISFFWNPSDQKADWNKSELIYELKNMIIGLCGIVVLILIIGHIPL